MKLTYIAPQTRSRRTAPNICRASGSRTSASTSSSIRWRTRRTRTGSTRSRPAFNLLIDLWGSDWGDPANWHNQLFDSQADFYHSHWKNDEFDRLVRDAAVMPDAEASASPMYEQAETILIQEAPIIPLFNLNRIYVIKPNVQGIFHYPILGRTWLRYISIVEALDEPVATSVECRSARPARSFCRHAERATTH